MAEVKPQSVKVELVQPTEYGGVEFIGISEETQEAVTITIQSKKYDEDARQRVADQETYDAAEAQLKELGASSVETAADELLDLAMTGDLVLPEVYISGDIASFKPLKSGFEEFEKQISNPTAKALEGQEVVSGPISEFKGIRFQFGVDAEDKDFTTKHYRVSQIVLDNDDEDTYSLKYITKQAQTIRDGIRNNEYDEKRLPKMKEIVEKLTEKSRANRVRELSEVLGMDLEKAMEEGYRLKGKIKMGAVGSGKQKVNFVTLLVDPTDFLIKPEVVEESDEN